MPGRRYNEFIELLEPLHEQQCATAAQNVIRRYKSLADIERGFRVLKSEIEIGPVYHRLPERIRAHASIRFMALILHRALQPLVLHQGKTGEPRPLAQRGGRASASWS